MAGVAYQMVVRYHIGGLRIENYKTDLPVQKGLSSSAACCVLAARAFNRIYDLKLTVRPSLAQLLPGKALLVRPCLRPLSSRHAPLSLAASLPRRASRSTAFTTLQLTLFI